MQRKVLQSLIFAVLLLTSCEPVNNTEQGNNNIGPEENNKTENSYYVRFEGGSTGVYNDYARFSMSAGSHKYSIDARSCTETLGPISQEDVISFSAKGINYQRATFVLKVYVSRNNEPFALVATEQGTAPYILYTIDF